MTKSDKNYKSSGLQNKYLPANIVPLPVFFVKAPVFTPASRNVNRKNEVRKVELNDYFGYSNVKIKGLPLNINMDFKILSYLLKLRDNCDENILEVNILDFAEMLGNKRRAVSKSTKRGMIESFERIVAQTITFSIFKENNPKDISSSKISNLITNIDTCFDKGTIEVTFNKNIKDIYLNDKFVQLLNMETFGSITGEVAKCLWLFYETNSKFVKFKRSHLLSRLQLKQKENKEINRQIKKAHEELQWMGYLTKYDYDKKVDTFIIKRHKNKRYDIEK
jgi:hypothetical protein